MNKTINIKLPKKIKYTKDSNGLYTVDPKSVGYSANVAKNYNEMLDKGFNSKTMIHLVSNIDLSPIAKLIILTMATANLGRAYMPGSNGYRLDKQVSNADYGNLIEHYLNKSLKLMKEIMNTYAIGLEVALFVRDQYVTLPHSMIKKNDFELHEWLEIAQQVFHDYMYLISYTGVIKKRAPELVKQVDDAADTTKFKGVWLQFEGIKGKGFSPQFYYNGVKNFNPIFAETYLEYDEIDDAAELLKKMPNGLDANIRISMVGIMANAHRCQKCKELIDKLSIFEQTKLQKMIEVQQEPLGA